MKKKSKTRLKGEIFCFFFFASTLLGKEREKYSSLRVPMRKSERERLIIFTLHSSRGKERKHSLAQRVKEKEERKKRAASRNKTAQR